jgi:hypothetical protein
MVENWNIGSVVIGIRHWENRHLACSLSAQAGCLCSQYKYMIPKFLYSTIPTKF